ncbi:sensor histidine kinase [Mongoliitalea daihaiensis]|uniref:sensor histidine kinase n=1 Tax=Mongoliitalea daihaiensis TaxID=2782006 RepID=UPI001F18C259|nr:histidine kinase [Mongoliitalea daihaiensis]UJP64861.1 histidine kinase [Mongoliitalea daihaiensis]
MQQLTFKKNISLLAHILIWALVGFILFLLFPISSGLSFPFPYWLKQIIMFSILIAIFYINYFYLSQQFLFKNQIAKFLTYNFLAGAVYIVILIVYDELWSMQEVMHGVFRPNVPYTPRPRNYSYDVSNLLVFYMSAGISTSIATIQKWQTDEKFRLELEQEKTNSELLYLKAQINPHFFFNTLNNIYSLANIDVEKAKTALLKLSRMMRYVLYETEKNHTLLTKELDFIKDFLELMRLRLSSKVQLQVDLPEKIEDAEIAPMILLPFIENCFKHGISSQQESPIHIVIRKVDQQLVLMTSNRIFKLAEDSPEAKASGIGLTNTKRRLDLLYPSSYQLEIREDLEEGEYDVHLTLTLS